MTWLDLKSLGEEKTKLVAQAGEILKKEDRSAEDEVEIRSLHDAADKLTEQIEMVDAQEHLEKTIEERIGREDSVEDTDGNSVLTSPEYRKAYWNCVRNPSDLKAQAEFRAVSSIGVGSDPAAGFVPASFADRFVEVVTNYQGMNNAGVTVLNTSDGRSLPIPKIDDSSNTGSLVSEHSASADDDTNDPTTSQVVLTDFNVDSDIIRVSDQLLRDSAFPVEEFLGNALFVRVARRWNALMTVGTGSAQPRGISIDTTEGVDAASATAVTYGELRDLENSVDIEYQSKGDLVWMMHQNTFNIVKKLVDDQSRPIFGTGNISEGTNNLLLGYRVVLNNSVAAMASLGKSIYFGYFGAYYWRQIGAPRLQRFDELYKATYEVGFRVTHSGDGALTDATAVKHLVNASS